MSMCGKLLSSRKETRIHVWGWKFDKSIFAIWRKAIFVESMQAMILLVALVLLSLAKRTCWTHGIMLQKHGMCGILIFQEQDTLPFVVSWGSNNLGILICIEGMLQPSVKDKVQSLLIDNSMGDLAKWKANSQYFMDEKIVYRMKIKAEQLLVHPQNRGSLQVFNMQSKGQRILQCGLRWQSPCMKATQSMSPQSQAMKGICPWAPVLCPSPSRPWCMGASLQRMTWWMPRLARWALGWRLTRISSKVPMKGGCGQWPHSLLKNLGFTNDICFPMLPQRCTMMHWWICFWFVHLNVYALQHSTYQEAFATLPTFIQGALNATNICLEAVDEMELLSTIALRAKQMLLEGKDPDFSKTAQMSAAGSVQLYASLLGKFVKMYGGGSPFDIISCLLQWPKHLSGLGQGICFLCCGDRYSTTCLFPLTRAAFLCCNLTAPKAKIQDGLSRLLTRSDVAALKGKKGLQSSRS